MMLGAGEIVVVLAVALMVLGPKRMPEVARQIARMLGQLRRVSEELRAGVDDVLREDAAQRPPEPSFLQRLAEQARAEGPAPAPAPGAAPEAGPQCDGTGAPRDAASVPQTAPVPPAEAEHVPYDQMFEPEARPAVRPAVPPETEAPAHAAASKRIEP